ncbi:MAG: hypothetical protein V4559_01895 [Pseudomonadota bacterium]
MKPFLKYTSLAAFLFHGHAAIADDNLSEVIVTNPKAVAGLTKKLSTAFADSGVHIRFKQCRFMVTESVTTSREGNVSFGGLCDVAGSKDPRPVKVCADEMVGHLELSSPNYEDSFGKSQAQANVTEFVKAHCVGG